MKARSLADAGVHLGAAREPLGRARRFDAGEGREVLRLDDADAVVAQRLLALGAVNVGGFVDGGSDPEGVWLLRTLGGASVAEVFRREGTPLPWTEARPLLVGLVAALAACEARSLFPGPLGPRGVRLSGEGVTLVADGLVHALLGAPSAAARTGTSEPAWTPPEQSEGAPWDGAANRYVLGLIAYRWLAGSHPFTGAGLRHALGEAARRGAPPFDDAVGAALPPGLQALVLRLLEPAPERRPESAAAIVRELDAITSGKAPLERPRADRLSSNDRAQRASREVPTSPSPRAPEPPPEARGPLRHSRRLWPVAAGVVALALAFVALPSVAPPREVTPSARPLAVTAPLAEARTLATDCASCHPRQATEWQRSIMAHSVKSPLFNGLESLIEEEVGRSDDCPGGAGILRRADPRTACRDPQSGQPITGSGGEHWCTNCHSPLENRTRELPPWEGRVGGDPRSRLPVRDLLGARAMEGISCGFCHTVHGPVGARGARGYEGNPTWTSFVTGATFAARPEDRRGLFGIANSGYSLKPEVLLARDGELVAGAHGRPPEPTRAYLRTSEFCGACHDVRLFGTDVLGARRGEHFKRLRNAYSEWATWADDERRRGRSAATCQDCHMSAFPGTCVAGEGGAEGPGPCPEGTHFVAAPPGTRFQSPVAVGSTDPVEASTHYLSGVDMPLDLSFPEGLVDEEGLDVNGVPLSAKRRRDMLLQAAVALRLDGGRLRGGTLEIPVEIENIGAGHRVPAGFSQERELWVHLVVRDGSGRVVYEVGRVERPTEDLRDKQLVRVSVTAADRDREGRPLGVFGADVIDGPDVPRWSPPPERGGTTFRGRGLVSFQNGFMRCVRCIGVVRSDGSCEALPGQVHRADRFEDGEYDLDTGECRSNLDDEHALFETYFPVGSLDARRGVLKGPDAIIDTRSLPPNVPVRYVYELDVPRGRGPFEVTAELNFRAFPPYLIRAFAAYERERARLGQRPSGPSVTEAMLSRIEVVPIATRRIVVP